MKLHKIVSLLPLCAISVANAGGVTGGNANSDWSIYGWQSVSYEFRTADDANAGSDRSTQQYNDNASNIGFMASIDTGMSMGGQSVNAIFKCEQFTFRNRNTGTGFCNRNSELGLQGSFGHIMLGQWLLPANEIIAQWIDPFYDHDMNSHANLFGNMGYGALYYNGGFGQHASGVGAGDSFASTNQAFNRRQEEIVQYWTPNIGGFQGRIATSNSNGTASGSDILVTDSNGSTSEVDPRIWSMGVAYENTMASGDNIWFAVAYELHDEWAAVDYGCSDSKDESFRLAGRYIHQWSGGSFTRISVAWENLQYDWEDCAGGTYLANSAAASALGANANNLDVEKDTWLVSGVHNFGNGFDFRFMYTDSGELDCDTCTDDSDTDANNLMLGVFYNTPAGTEFRLTYNQLNNEDNAQYDYTITPAGTVLGEDARAFGVGVTQWF